MANKFNKGHTFVPGEVVDPDDLNNLVDLATALSPLITDQGTVTAAVGDSVLISDVSDSGNLKKVLVSSLGVGTVTAVGFTIDSPASTTFGITPASITAADTFHFSTKPQGANKVFVAPDGSSGQPGFRLLLPGDTEALHSILALDIDCSLGNAFSKVLTTNSTFHLYNAIAGQTIVVWVRQAPAGGKTVAWDTDAVTLNWRGGGAAPTMTTTADHVDIFTFFCTGSELFGGASQNYF